MKFTRSSVGCLLALMIQTIGVSFSMAAAEAIPTDQELTGLIRSSLEANNGAAAAGLNVRTRDGVVLLSGSAGSLPAKEGAVRMAMGTLGVREVMDLISVQPIQRPDEAIRGDVVQAMTEASPLRRFPIRAAVANGVVTLTGLVESGSDKRLATETIQGIRGVRAINNQTTVDPATERPDREIQADIQRRFESEVGLTTNDAVTVSVRDGNVRLAGTVDRAFKQSEAVAQAWVAGVRYVDARLLTVDPLARKGGERHAEDPGQLPTGGAGDNRVIEQVSHALSRDPFLRTLGIQVSASEGLVYLHGTVYTGEERARAEEITAQVEGVLGIQNNILVLADEAPALSENGSYDYGDGSVYPDVYCPPNYPWPYSDTRIRDNIKDQLFRDNFVNAFRVRVRVQDGIAILTGAVSDWAVRCRAELNAYEGGARYVVNYLMIRP